MGVEVRPLGVKCNIACHYCYQDPMRALGTKAAREYDLDLIKKSVLAQGGPFVLFGGEPLLMPLADLEDLFDWGYRTFGSSTVQTNGTIMTARHINLFKKFNVGVGISIDGPGECNSARWAGDPTRTIRATSRSENAILELLRGGLTPSIITTLHRFNASAAMLPRLLAWFRYLDEIGVRAARIHLLEVESAGVRDALALSETENCAAMIALDELEKTHLQRLRFDLFREMKALLLARDQEVSCVWRACDAYTTEAVQGIEGYGEASNCGRTNKAGVDYIKAEARGFERYIALYNTPIEYGGCQGCRFFLACKGQCPGTSLEGDWRNRTEHCSIWFTLLERAESELLSQEYLPISQDPNRASLEAFMVAQWEGGRNPSLHSALASMRALSRVQQAV